MGKKKPFNHRDHRDHREDLGCHVRAPNEPLRHVKRTVFQKLCGLCGLCGESFGRLKKS